VSIIRGVDVPEFATVVTPASSLGPRQLVERTDRAVSEEGGAIREGVIGGGNLVAAMS